MLDDVVARYLEPHLRVAARVSRRIVLVEEPLDGGVWPEPLRSLLAVQLLKLLQDRDVRLGIHRCPLWYKVLEERNDIKI